MKGLFVINVYIKSVCPPQNVLSLYLVSQDFSFLLDKRYRNIFIIWMFINTNFLFQPAHKVPFPVCGNFLKKKKK